MEILSKEFKNLLKRNLICRFVGHKSSKWLEEWWAIGHSTGYMVRVCERCNLTLEKRSQSSEQGNKEKN